MDKSKNKSLNKNNGIRKEASIDEKSVRTLAKLLEETHLTEIEYQFGNQRIRVVRNGVASSYVSAPLDVRAAPLPLHHPSSPPPPVSRGEPVLSPMVGTVYLAPEPGAPNFVKADDTVKKGDTLLIIEAMKVMNPIRAPRDGKVLEVLASDAKPVEFGETLLILE